MTAVLAAYLPPEYSLPYPALADHNEFYLRPYTHFLFVPGLSRSRLQISGVLVDPRRRRTKSGVPRDVRTVVMATACRQFNSHVLEGYDQC